MATQSLRIVILALNSTGLVAGGAASPELTYGEAGSIRHEEPAGLLEDLLELDLFVVLAGELFGVGVELLELGLVA